MMYNNLKLMQFNNCNNSYLCEVAMLEIFQIDVHGTL